MKVASEIEVKCPICNSEAVYKYGKTKTGKQRFQCLMCGRQFSHNAKKHEILGKPHCPDCSKIMHLYKIDGEIVRFRCSGYPSCKKFKKFRILKEED